MKVLRDNVHYNISLLYNISMNNALKSCSPRYKFFIAPTEEPEDRDCGDERDEDCRPRLVIEISLMSIHCRV